MILAAIYIYDHFLFNDPIVLNFGGKYSYNIWENPNTIHIKREENKHYVENFFDDNAVLLNVSSLVGSNGSGKSTLLIEIIDALLHNRENNIVVFESGEQVILHNFLRTGKSLNVGEFEIANIQVDLNTIFYSPYLDFKPETSGIDLSFDNILGKDLETIFDLAPQERVVSPKQVLKHANFKRFKNLQSSDLAEDIRRVFDFPDDSFYRVSFTRYRINADSDGINFHNTPEEFQPLLHLLFSQIREDAQKIRESKRGTPEDQFILQKNLLKNYILMDLYCILVKLMEMENTYLQEGHFKKIEPYSVKHELKEKSSLELFQLWLDDYYYSKGDSKNLPDKEVLALIGFLNNKIDKIEYEEFLGGSNLFKWDLKSIFLTSDEIDELYSLEQNFINGLSKYYSKKEEDNSIYYDIINQIPNYINFEPSSRNLSSGETAMLNLFSRIHEYFDNKLLQIPSDKKYKHYILLLDEADLGFHPKWKRSFVSTLIEFSKTFFDKIGAKVQIIFTTHDAISLSDLPNQNINYLWKDDNIKKILNINNPNRPRDSFGANITDLLSNSFFLKDSLMGDFAKNKIQTTINWLNSDETSQKRNHKKIIASIDEPILRAKLEEMYFNKFNSEFTKAEKKTRLKEMAKQLGIQINFNEE